MLVAIQWGWRCPSQKHDSLHAHTQSLRQKRNRRLFAEATKPPIPAHCLDGLAHRRAGLDSAQHTHQIPTWRPRQWRVLAETPRTTRNPLLLFRLAARQLFGVLFQEPPRSTRGMARPTGDYSTALGRRKGNSANSRSRSRQQGRMGRAATRGPSMIAPRLHGRETHRHLLAHVPHRSWRHLTPSTVGHSMGFAAIMCSASPKAQRMAALPSYLARFEFIDCIEALFIVVNANILVLGEGKQ